MIVEQPMRGRLLYLCVRDGSDSGAWHLPHRRARWHRRADDDVWEAVD